MSLYVQISDFGAQAGVARDKFTNNDLQDYIDKFEVRYLQDLLGCELYNEFAVDFAITGTEPTEQRFLDIWNPICKDLSTFSNFSGWYFYHDYWNCHQIVRSDGIKQMLVDFIYWEYTRDQWVKNNIAGFQKNEQANATQARFVETNVYNVYNQGIDSYNAIQYCICDNSNNYDYDSYNGIRKEKAVLI